MPPRVRARVRARVRQMDMTRAAYIEVKLEEAVGDRKEMRRSKSPKLLRGWVEQQGRGRRWHGRVLGVSHRGGAGLHKCAAYTQCSVTLVFRIDINELVVRRLNYRRSKG